MAEMGKYHGQRLKARDVLRLYAVEECDFRGAILRGCNFRGADLSGADFSGADIRSARFVDATLRGVKFCHARAGLQRRWWLGQLVLVGIIAALAGFLQAFAGALIGSTLVDYDPSTVAAGIAGLVAAAIVFFAIARQGFTLKALGSVAVAVASLLFFIYANRRIHRVDSIFENLHIIGLAFAALGGTTFSGADLAESTFVHAHLKSTNFANSRQRATILTHIRWHHVQNLDRARLGTSNLQDPRVRTLLTTLNGTDQDLSNADLRGANLAGAQLHNANLTEANCIGTDFTTAHLTGATLEAWNIDSTTILKDVECQFVFLLEHPNAQGSRERRPHNPDKTFQPGDFEKFFKEMLDTVQILIRQGIHHQVFKETVAQLMDTYDLPADAIQGFEKKGEDVLLTVAVPPETDKGQFEQDFDELQALKLKAAKTQGLLEGERKQADDYEMSTTPLRNDNYLLKK